MSSKQLAAIVRPHHPGADVSSSLRAHGLDVRPLPEAREVSPAGLRAAVGNRQARLFRGLVSGWPAMTRWTPAQLAARHGDTVVRALLGLPATGVLFAENQQRYERALTLAAFLEVMLSTPPEQPCYLAYQRVAELFPAADYDLAGLLGDRNTDPDTRAWIGSAGTRSMLHSDLKDNLFCQLWGEKHIVLVPWAHSRAVYPFPDNVVNSQLDLADLDLERHPRLRQAVLYTGTMTPGDLLYIPRGWWHDIRSRTPSVSLNHWFGPPTGFASYLNLILRLGPSCWSAVARDFYRGGLKGRDEQVTFFFSPPSTGKRVFDALRWGNFSRANDPAKD